MNAPAIEAIGVEKRYRLGAAPSQSIREAAMNALAKPFRWARRDRSQNNSDFAALTDVSFSIDHGEAVGIIGRNGAGKSTLLKILSRITPPSRGEVRVRGRIASLLEVGTGFHSELTGRENVFLSGAILGMKRHEILESFDEIVAFAEVETFIDTPVKRYSSGMYMRLAFAIAAHLRPEILVLDEVLAVGDSAFQKKCLGKMGDAARGGRTVLFVSHNMAAVTRLCQRAILLQKGRVVADGRVDEVVRAYIGGNAGESPVEVDYVASGRRVGTDAVRLLGARVESSGMRNALVDIRRSVRVEMSYEVTTRTLVFPYFQVNDEEGTCLFIVNPSWAPEHRSPTAPGVYRASAEIPGNYLAEGMYSLDIGVSTPQPLMTHAHERGALAFQIHDPGEGDSARGAYAGNYPGVIRPAFPWSIDRQEEKAESDVSP